jgi:hypothetical protein
MPIANAMDEFNGFIRIRLAYLKHYENQGPPQLKGWESNSSVFFGGRAKESSRCVHAGRFKHFGVREPLLTLLEEA